MEGNEIYGAYQSGNRLVIQDVTVPAFHPDRRVRNTIALRTGQINLSCDRITNVEGRNYLYVYRKGVKDPESGENSDALNNAALDGTPGRDVYGSTDLSADFTQDTLYYSDEERGNCVKFVPLAIRSHMPTGSPGALLELPR